MLLSDRLLKRMRGFRTQPADNGPTGGNDAWSEAAGRRVDPRGTAGPGDLGPAPLRRAAGGGAWPDHPGRRRGPEQPGDRPTARPDGQHGAPVAPPLARVA